MIVLGKIEWGGVTDFGGDRSVAAGRQRLGVGRLRGLGCGALRSIKHIDAGAVLRPHVIALTHSLRWIMTLPERLQQLLVAHFFWIKNHKHRFGVTRAPGAHFLIGRIGRIAAAIADRGHEYRLTELPELFLRAPETAEPEECRLKAVRIGPLERMTVDEMATRGPDRR